MSPTRPSNLLGSKNLDESELCYLDSAAFAQELHARGQFLAAAPLQPTFTATTVRRKDGQPLVTDGPFAETREQLGGYFLIDVKDLDEAIAISLRAYPAGVGAAWRSVPSSRSLHYLWYKRPAVSIYPGRLSKARLLWTVGQPYVPSAVS